MFFLYFYMLFSYTYIFLMYRLMYFFFFPFYLKSVFTLNFALKRRISVCLGEPKGSACVMISVCKRNVYTNTKFQNDIHFMALTSCISEMFTKLPVQFMSQYTVYIYVLFTRISNVAYILILVLFSLQLLIRVILGNEFIE